MINQQGFIVAKSQRVIDRQTLNLCRNLKPVSYFTEAEFLAIKAGSVFFVDTECYPNFWYCAFKCATTGKIVDFELSPDRLLDITRLRWMLWRTCCVGFNTKTYDDLMIAAALSGMNNHQLKCANDFLINDDLDENGKKIKVTAFMFEQKFKLKIDQTNRIDLFDVAPLTGSLKLYAGRLHCQRMQDLPFEPNRHLTAEEAAIVRPYCANDLDATELLYNELLPEIKLRIEMTAEYKVDLRSKSDAQVAEAVICTELAKLLGYYPKKPIVAEGTILKYNVPDYMCFQTPACQKALEDIRNAEFHLDGGGSPLWPKGLGELTDGKYELKVQIAKTMYKLGMGGFHSMEKTIAHYADDNTLLLDIDVESFYPRTILNQRLFPVHLTDAFLKVYEMIVNTRLHAKKMAAKCKREGDKEGAKKWKTIADSLKITINGSFGKLGSKWSALYAPQLMLQVTITGQLVLMMLIEALEAANIPVVSGNTDGIICKFPKALYNEHRRIVEAWETHTNYKMEETRYAATYSRDVNNYFATKLKYDENKGWTDEIEEIKVKGVYAERGSALNSVLSKNPESLIVSDAVQKYILHRTPVHKTITECQDIRRFVSVKNVKGGGEKNGMFLGKVVRWYYPKNEGGYIAYVGSGNKVGKTDGARPLMDLPETFPTDINFDYYIKEANDALYEVGLLKKAKTGSLFF